MNPSPRTVPVVFALALALVGGAEAQHAVRMQMSDSTEISVTAESGTPEVPFKVTNNHLLLPVSVRGSEFDVILDTGMPAPGLALYTSPRTDGLDLDIDPEMEVQVAGAGGEGRTMPARMAIGESLEMPGVRLDHASIILMPTSHFGAYHEGIIGYSLFDRFVVELDYDARLMRLHEPASYEVPDGAYVLPLTLRNNLPYTTIRVTPTEGPAYDAEVVIDLGASHAISLNVDESDRISRPQAAVTTVVGRGLSGEVLGDVGRVARIDLGGAVLTDVVTSFPVSEHQNPRGVDSLAGNLGSEVLRRFTTVFDYAHGRMILIPNRSFAEPFLFDRSGLRFDHDGSLVVRGVLPGSPAEESGIRVGDLLTHLDGEPVSGEDVYEIRETLKGSGEVRISLRRGDQALEKRLALRRLI